MLISIDKIKVSDRIRKDYGDIEDLAQDIKENGLINPPVVTPDFELIAGERRLRAMKHLGYQQVEVRVMQVKDYEHMLKLEINENENRKDFTRLERLEYARRLERIERVKAKKRMGQGSQNSDELGRTDDAVASKLGIGSRDTYRKEKYIAEHADKETLDAWDKGDISTHKAYTEIKKAKEEAEQRAKELEHQIADMQEELTTFKTLLNKERIKNKQEPKVIEKEVVKKIEVVPDSIVQRINEYEDKIAELQERAGDLDKAKMELSEYRRQRDEIAEEVAELKGTMRRLHEEYSGKNENLTKQSLVINKFRSSIQPIKKAKGELEQAFSAMTEMSASGKAQMMHELKYLYDFADFVGEELERLETGEVFYDEYEG